ncbi:hypothetical protein [Cellulomonas shaoxiangyii]|uniref:hypothetical protein n=1 Tax=Cellulomonas shaoxiangyii TaxID=2566013 RepID=UPI00140A1D7F|nr:hypothetical protein [Cellulomonas shaoxiangyii]
MLTTLVLPLLLEVPSDPPSTRRAATSVHDEIFARGQRPARRRVRPRWISRVSAPLPWNDRAGAPWNDLEGEDDLGLGLPYEVAHRVFSLGGAAVRFGASDLTLGECSTQAQVEARTWLVAPAVAVTLWWTRDALTLTIERLGKCTPEEQRALLTSPEVARDVANAVPLLLAGTGLPRNASLADLLGESPLRVRSGMWGRRFRRSLWRAPVEQLCIRGIETIRGTSLSEAFLAITAPDASSTAAALWSEPPPERSGRFADHQIDQESGAPRGWTRWNVTSGVGTSDDPSSSMRDDRRAALVNLESLSVNHCYKGELAGGGWIAAAIPVIAHRAAAARDHRNLVLAFRARRPVDEKVDAVEAVRAGMLARRLTSGLVGGERFAAWTTPTQLATALWDATTATTEARERDEAGERIAEAVRDSLDRHQLRRRRSVDRWIRRLSPGAAVTAVVGLYATLASLPDPAADQGLFAAVPDAVRVTVGLVVVGCLAGLIVDWVLDRDSSRNRR